MKPSVPMRIMKRFSSQGNRQAWLCGPLLRVLASSTPTHPGATCSPARLQEVHLASVPMRKVEAGMPFLRLS